MWILYSILALTALMFALGLFCLKGRTGHPGLAQLRQWNYAHRGLHDAEKPENSMAAFRTALEGGFGIELDIHLMQDDNLAVIHDSSLKRVADVDVRIEDLRAGELSNYHLGGTGECIPLFAEVLDLFSGKAPLIVELKAVDHNHIALCKAACRLLDNYDGPYCIESFDPRVVAWFRKHRPTVIRGQLSENWMGRKHPVPAILRWMMTHHISNVYTRPDFIAYKYADRNGLATKLCRKLWKIQGVSWTIKTSADFETAVKEGWIPIFEGFIP
jgi:glycerophosphoryl diester phosphodiesterase